MSTRATPKTLSKTSKRTVVKNAPPQVVQESQPQTTVETQPQTTVETQPQTTVTEQVKQETPVMQQVENMTKKFDTLITARMEQLTVTKNELLELKKMQKEFLLTVKNLTKRTKRKRPLVNEDGTPRKPSGFASPVVVSDLLYKFLEQFGVQKGQPIARTDVTRFVTQYIKEKNLQNPEHRREIVPDKALREIFGEPVEHKDPNDPSSPKVWTYLRMQKYLSSHFPKKQ
jgi:chromatin remodeling complex protein RSC6